VCQAPQCINSPVENGGKQNYEFGKFDSDCPRGTKNWGSQYETAPFSASVAA